MASKSSVPSTDLVMQCFNDQLNQMKRLTAQKINDNNTWKATSAEEGHLHKVALINVHRLLFNTLISVKCSSQECLNRDKKQIVFCIESIWRMKEILGECYFSRYHHNSDITIAAPWGYLKDGVTTSANNSDNLCIVEKGTYVIVLKEFKNDSMKVFVPCGGPDALTDEVAEWVGSVPLNDICDVNIDKLPFTISQTKCLKIDRDDECFIASKGECKEGDIVLFNGESVKVIAVNIDFNSDQRNSVWIEGKFKRSHISQHFKIKRLPRLQGKVINVEAELLSCYRPFVIKFMNGPYSVGTIQYEFHNFCFNSLGFLTHDTAKALSPT